MATGSAPDPAGITIGAAPECHPSVRRWLPTSSQPAEASGPSRNRLGAERGAGTSTASNVNILGNHIGMNALGTTSVGTAFTLVDVGEADDVTISGNLLGGGGIVGL